MSESWFRKKYSIKVNNKSKDFGSTDTKHKVISINKRKSKSSGVKGELLDSIQHEINHARYPNRGEKRIENMTKRSTAKLSKKSKSKLYKLISK